MRDRFQRDVIDARKPGRCAIQQVRKFAAISFGQVPLGQPNLLFNEVEVIEQPFSGRRNPAGRLHCFRQQIADSDQDAFVLGQPAQEPVRSLALAQLVETCQGFAVLLHLVGAEELRTQWRLTAGVLFG